MISGSTGILDDATAFSSLVSDMLPWPVAQLYTQTYLKQEDKDRIAAEKDNFDYDAFFRAFAEAWLTKDTLQMAYTRINDNHPMCYLRINCTLQQFDEFLNYYGITEGDGMYLAPEDRVAIW